jgi:hypothetical protein
MNIGKVILVIAQLGNVALMWYYCVKYWNVKKELLEAQRVTSDMVDACIAEFGEQRVMSACYKNGIMMVKIGGDLDG